MSKLTVAEYLALRRIYERNGALHAGQVGFFVAIPLLLKGMLWTKAPFFFYTKRRFPYVGGYITTKLFLFTTYKAALTLRDPQLREQLDP